MDTSALWILTSNKIAATHGVPAQSVRRHFFQPTKFCFHVDITGKPNTAHACTTLAHLNCLHVINLLNGSYQYSQYQKGDLKTITICVKNFWPK
jgi:hypothetical protein